jgi:hypothetical protein
LYSRQDTRSRPPRFVFRSRAVPAGLSDLELTRAHGELVSEPELYGFAAENIFDAFRDVHTAAGVRDIESPLFHIQIRLPQQDHMTPEQWDITTARALKTAGLEGQPYARVFHTDEKTGEIHCHLATSIIDEQTHHAKEAA